MAAPGDRTTSLPSGQPPQATAETRNEPFALRFAWAIVAVAGAVSIGLVVAQLGWDWPFAPTRVTTTTQTLDPDGRVIELTTIEADSGGAREALFRTVAGIAALTAGLLAWGRLEQSRRQHLLDRGAAERAVEAQHLATRAQEATERGQVTQRFTTAVEQLGHTDSSVRLGALYALEALAHDSAGDRPAITDVVCAYARHHSIRRHPDGTPVLVDGGDNDRVEELVDGKAVDYQAAITIALRLPADWNLPIRDFRGTVVADLDVGPLELSDGCLGAVDFGGATFTGWARFSRATFTGYTDFEGAIFNDVSFDGATFGYAWFKRATFTGFANFMGANFNGGAYFKQVIFNEVAFDGATFTGDATFDEATFNGHALFKGATFTGDATFHEATFNAVALFYEATFTGVANFEATFEDHAGFLNATFADGLSLPSGVDPGPQFRRDPADPTKWYRRDPASRAEFRPADVS